jgi:RND superfamily putative drug exporter
MFASISTLIQAGFIIGTGLLLDTFLVRTITVPAIAVLVGKWNWWPSKPPRPAPRERLPKPASPPAPAAPNGTAEVTGNGVTGRHARSDPDTVALRS